MRTTLSPEIWEVIDAVHYRPAVSIILPLDVKISLDAEVRQKLNIILDKVALELIRNYPDEICGVVVERLKRVIDDIKFDLDKKSLAIFLSPIFEKVIFMNLPFEERITIDDSFEIRDLVYDLKHTDEYLVLIMSAKQSRTYYCKNSHFERIILDDPEVVTAYVNDPPEKVSNFTDANDRKQILINKFLNHMDREIAHLLKIHQLPLFVLGTKKVIGHFRKVTKYKKEIITYTYANCDEVSFPKLKDLLKPSLDLWRKNKMIHLVERLEEAAGRGNLVAGIKEIWHEVSNQRSGLLVVECNYTFAAQRGASIDLIEPLSEPYNEFSYIRDAVDDLIEKVLLSGGDVEFTDQGALDHFQNIALIAFH